MHFFVLSWSLGDTNADQKANLFDFICSLTKGIVSDIV